VGIARQLNNPDERTIALGDLRRRIRELRKKAEAAEDTGERRVARRVLRQVYVQCYEAGTIYSAKDGAVAATQLEAAAEIAPRDPSAFYQLAIVYARRGEKRRAIEALERAVANGLRDPALIETDRDLGRLSTEREYRKIIEGLKIK
jgi:predicted Zn-dependent protease